MAPLRQRFVARCAEDLAWLSAWTPEAPLEELEHRVHRLAGGAGVFGFAELGEAASRLDQLIASDRRVAPELLRELLERLKQVAGPQAA